MATSGSQEGTTESHGSLRGVTQYTPPSYCAGPITAGPDGNLWFTEPCSAASDVGAKVAKLTPSGAFTEYVVPRVGDVPADPSDTAAGPDGNIWFIEESAHKVVKLTPSGSFTEYPIPSGYKRPERHAIKSSPVSVRHQNWSGSLPLSGLSVGHSPAKRQVRTCYVVLNCQLWLVRSP